GAEPPARRAAERRSPRLGGLRARIRGIARRERRGVRAPERRRRGRRGARARRVRRLADVGRPAAARARAPRAARVTDRAVRIAIGAIVRTLGGPATYATELVAALVRRRAPDLE